MTISQINPKVQNQRAVEGRLASGNKRPSRILKRIMTGIRVTRFFTRNRLKGKRLETEAAKNGPPPSASARLFPEKLFFRVCSAPTLEMSFLPKSRRDWVAFPGRMPKKL